MPFQAAKQWCCQFLLVIIKRPDQTNNSHDFIDKSIKISHTPHNTKENLQFHAWFLWRGVCKSPNIQMWLVHHSKSFQFQLGDDRLMCLLMLLLSGCRRIRITFDTFCFLVLFTIFQFCQMTKNHLHFARSNTFVCMVEMMVTTMNASVSLGCYFDIELTRLYTVLTFLNGKFVFVPFFIV